MSNLMLTFLKAGKYWILACFFLRGALKYTIKVLSSLCDFTKRGGITKLGLRSEYYDFKPDSSDNH